MTLAETLKAFRLYTSWTQTEVAEAIPVSVRTYQRWEAGDVVRPVPLVQRRLHEIMRAQHFDPQAPPHVRQAS